jgi:hypothetical protein
LASSLWAKAWDDGHGLIGQTLATGDVPWGIGVFLAAPVNDLLGQDAPTQAQAKQAECYSTPCNGQKSFPIE